jgi:hypothetical protein
MSPRRSPERSPTHPAAPVGSRSEFSSDEIASFNPAADSTFSQILDGSVAGSPRCATNNRKRTVYQTENKKRMEKSKSNFCFENN